MPWGTWPLAACAVALALCANAAVADELDPEFDLWPLVYYDTEPGRDCSRIEVLYPLFERTRDGSVRETRVRPLWRWRSGPALGLRWCAFAWPLFRSMRDGARSDSSLLVYWSATRDRGRLAITPLSLTLFPIVFVEKTRAHGLDVAVFPLFGSMHNRFGRDRITFALWPIYTLEKDDERTTHNVLWPLMSFSRSPDGSGWKFWPLYGQRRRHGRCIKRFVLWPLYSAIDARVAGAGLYQARMYWPFYGWERSPRGYAHSWLWPLASHVVDRDKGSESWRYLWLLAGKRRGPRQDVTACLPLFRHKVNRDRGTEQIVALYPFWWQDKLVREGYRKQSWRLVPVFWRIREDWPSWGRRSTFTQVWPLLRWERQRDYPDGAVTSERVSLLSLWPFRDVSNVWPLYGPFFRVVEYRRDPGGMCTTRLLWRVFSHKRAHGYQFTELWPLVAFGHGPDASRFALLKGLFETQRRGPERYLRLIYLPRFSLSRVAAQAG